MSCIQCVHVRSCGLPAALGSAWPSMRAHDANILQHSDAPDTPFQGGAYADVGEEGPSDEFGKMIYRLMVVAYFVLLPSYFWYRWCVHSLRSVQSAAPIHSLYLRSVLTFPAKTVGCTPSNGMCHIECTTKIQYVSRRCSVHARTSPAIRAHPPDTDAV